MVVFSVDCLRLLSDFSKFSTPFLLVDVVIHSSSSSFLYFKNFVVEYVVNIAEERIHAGPTKCLLFAKVVIREGTDDTATDGVFAKASTAMENATFPDEGDASVAIDEYFGESGSDMCRDKKIDCWFMRNVII